MTYWLLKTEPGSYSFDDLVRDGGTYWDGVRNYQARNNLRKMSKGDLCMIYHSVGPKLLVGLARVVGEAYQDPTTDDERWVAIDIEPVTRLATPVSLRQIKEIPELGEMALVKQSRLSVAPVTAEQWELIMKLAQTRLG